MALPDHAMPPDGALCSDNPDAAVVFHVGAEHSLAHGWWCTACGEGANVQRGDA